MNITFDPAVLSGFLMALVRAAAWVFVAPPFGTRMVPVTVKVGLSAALAVSLGPNLRTLAVPLEAGPLIGGVVLQVMAGVALGFVAVLLFSAFQAAGSMIDLFGGLTVAQLFDPLTQQTTSIFGRFYQLLATVLLFAVDGHLLLMRGFLDSFGTAPFAMPGSETVADGFIGGLSMFFVAALEIAAPLLVALFLADLAMGLLARSAPEMNVFLLGLPVKLLITFSMVGLAIPLLPEAVRTITRTVVEAGGALGGG